MNNSMSRIHLYSTPSFLKGIARLADWFSQLDRYSESSTPQQADFLALRTDWYSVGDDLMYAISAYEQENPVLETEA